MPTKVRDVEPARLDEALSGFRSGDGGPLWEAVAGESEGEPSSDESGADAGEREPGLPALPRVGDSPGGPSSQRPVRGRVATGGVLEGADAVFRQASPSSGLEAAVLFTRCTFEDT